MPEITGADQGVGDVPLAHSRSHVSTMEIVALVLSIIAAPIGLVAATWQSIGKRREGSPVPQVLVIAIVLGVIGTLALVPATIGLKALAKNHEDSVRADKFCGRMAADPTLADDAGALVPLVQAALEAQVGDPAGDQARADAASAIDAVELRLYNALKSSGQGFLPAFLAGNDLYEDLEGYRLVFTYDTEADIPSNMWERPRSSSSTIWDLAQIFKSKTGEVCYTR